MKVFISWSGAKSLAVAEVLREELPCLIQDLETFVSSEDIEKGSAWFQSITTELDKSGFGIICLTAENLHSRWVHFEAGALAGRFTQTKVAPLLIELDQAQVPQPLSQLQLTKLAEVDFLRLLLSINKNTSKPLTEDVLKKSFDRSWQHISAKIEKKLAALPKPNGAPIAERSQKEILEELLSTTRSMATRISNIAEVRPAIPVGLGFGNHLVSGVAPNPLSELAAYAQPRIRFRRVLNTKTGKVEHVPFVASPGDEGDIPVGEFPTSENGESLT
jgi:hypothetical protein